MEEEVMTGAEEQEVAEPATSEAETEGVNDAETAEPQAAEQAPEQTPEQNHIYADMRRRAEAEAKKKYEALEADLNRKYAETFKGYKNPETNQPIQTAAEYLEAMAAQERIQARNKMQEAGIDPEMLDRAIANSPLVRRAEEIERANVELQTKQMIEEDIQAIIKLDPTVGTADDIYSQDNFGEVVDYCNKHEGVRMAEAYKLVNFDRLAGAQAQASKQAAINQAKSKDHMVAAKGVTDPDKSVDIPEGQIANWKRWFPDKSAKELRALYNKSIGG